MVVVANSIMETTIEHQLLKFLDVYKVVCFNFSLVDKQRAFEVLQAVAVEKDLPLTVVDEERVEDLAEKTERIAVFFSFLALYQELSGAAKLQLQSKLIKAVEFAKKRKNTYLIFCDYSGKGLPPFLANLIPQIDLPFPDNWQIQETIELFFAGKKIDWSSDERMVSAVGGLSKEEISLGLNLAWQNASNDPVLFLQELMAYKRSQLQKVGLEFLAKPEINHFGGLDRLKLGIERISADYSPQARELKIPFPKGWLLAGPPGTGKTFAAKVCAAQLGFPLISVGVDLVKSQGSAYLRKLLARIEAVAPCLCYFDEFDKFFNANTGAESDSKAKEVLGVLLTWLQEKTSQTFVIATLNRLDALPPELTRSGRFDKIYYVDFPQAIERKEIIQLHASGYDRRYGEGDGPLSIEEWRTLLNRTQKCTGAELREIVILAAKEQFYRGCQQIQLGLSDFLEARTKVKPLYLRDTERVLAMENRAKGVAESASSMDNSIFAPANLTLWGDELN